MTDMMVVSLFRNMTIALNLHEIILYFVLLAQTLPPAIVVFG